MIIIFIIITFFTVSLKIMAMDGWEQIKGGEQMPELEGKKEENNQNIKIKTIQKNKIYWWRNRGIYRWIKCDQVAKKILMVESNQYVSL